MDGHWDKSFEPGLCQRLEGLSIEKEKVAKLCRTIEDNYKDNSVVLGRAVRTWDENWLPRIVLFFVPDLQTIWLVSCLKSKLEVCLDKTLSSVESHTFFFTKY